MYQRSREARLDEDLVLRVAGLSRAAQRWLRMALLAMEDVEAVDEKRDARRERKRGAEEERVRDRPVANLEEVITGKSTLDEQLEAYPELSEEMEGLADVIDLLREAGQARRRTGEQILREEILGKPPEESGEDEEDEGEEGSKK